MERFYMDVSKGTVSVCTSIIDLIPVGEENPIRRDDLTRKCVEAGLIDVDCIDKDRKMRRLLEKARIDATIVNMSNGRGYYRPLKTNPQGLRRYIKQEDNRAISSYRNHRNAKAFFEDVEKGRFEA